ncbi:MAG: class I SAM-dependent methyltransferase [Candidatus Symbiothrix sp.]|jgi:23S rRNA (cytosine1962-C5)-methyltransferase|nr:class I SAM-dependent methyltransferase [Candidatus Symbiothrix sp.]
MQDNSDVLQNKNMELLTPQNWHNYELIDSGDYEKLERFGKYILRRPEPQAVWRKALPEKEWAERTDAWFKKEKGKSALEGNEKGEWILKPHTPQQWFINYTYHTVETGHALSLRFRLGLTAFKHVGIFPEQAENWNYIYDSVQRLNREQPKVLNLFAYTGGASLAAKAAGADVTHVDSVKQVLNWARENMEASGLDNIRWVLEDALKFVKREVKREKRYQGIILDPPAYGRGPDGEKWILEDNIAELMEACSRILEPQNSFCVLNLYSMGFSSLIAESLMKDYFPNASQIEFGELFLPDNSKRKLPLSVFCRIRT